MFKIIIYGVAGVDASGEEVVSTVEILSHFPMHLTVSETARQSGRKGTKVVDWQYIRDADQTPSESS